MTVTTGLRCDRASPAICHPHLPLLRLINIPREEALDTYAYLLRCADVQCRCNVSFFKHVFPNS